VSTDTLPRVSCGVRLPSQSWRSAAVGLALALILIGAVAPQAAAAHRGAGSSGARSQGLDSCSAVVASGGPVIPHQTVGSADLNGLKVRLRAAHPARWILTVMVSARIARRVGDLEPGGAFPIGATTKRFPKPARATILVPLDGAVLPPGLKRLSVTLIWTEYEQISRHCTVFYAGRVPATVGQMSSGNFLVG
jgi:hypothetical protein